MTQQTGVPTGDPVDRGRRLHVLAVDDEAPQLGELVWLLERDPRIGRIEQTESATDALRILRETEVDAVLLDISMPGLNGLDLAGVLANFKQPPAVVFVSAYDEHAVAAFELAAVDYVLKPVREERLTKALNRVVEHLTGRSAPKPDDRIAVELGGVTRFVSRADIRYVEAQGDYARLHVGEASHLLRTPLSVLADDWRDAGFVRIHRSLLVNLAHVSAMRTDGGRCIVVVDGADLVVSRRHTPELRELLGSRGRPVR